MSLDNFIPLSITIAGLIALLIERRENAAMGATDHFHVKGLEARIDRARREVHIFVKDCPRAFRAHLGHLIVEHKIETVTLAHEKRPKRRCSITLASNRRRLLATGHYVASSDWAETVWTTVETGKTWVRLRAIRLPGHHAQHLAGWEEGQASTQTDAMDVPLPNGNARAFKLWLDQHQREFFPDQTCAEVLRACQSPTSRNLSSP